MKTSFRRGNDLLELLHSGHTKHLPSDGTLPRTCGRLRHRLYNAHGDRRVFAFGLTGFAYIGTDLRELLHEL